MTSSPQEHQLDWGAEALSSAISLSLTRLVLGDLGLTPNQA